MGTKPASSWSVKGIDTSARAAAKEAARQRGMTLGEWLNETILSQAHDSSAKGRSAKSAPRGKRRDDEIAGKLDELSEQLRALVRSGQVTAVDRFAAPSEEETAQYAGLAERITRNEEAMARTFAALDERLDDLAARLPGDGGDAAESPGYQELETALRNVVDHMEATETRTAETLARIQERLEAVAEEAAQAARMPGNAPDARSLEELETRLGDLAERLTRMQQTTDEQVRAYVDRHMGALVERVDAVHLASQSLPQRVEGLIGQVTGDKLAEVEDRIETMVASLRGKLEDMAAGALDVERINAEVEALGRKMEDLARQSVSAADMEAMRQAITQLSATVETKADQAEVNGLGARIDEVLREMEKERAEGGYLPQISALEDKVRELEAAVRETAAQTGHEAVAALDAQVAGLDARLRQTEGQMTQLPELEEAMASLRQSLDESLRMAGDESRKVAEAAALRIAGEAAASAGGEDERTSTEIEALKKGLKAIREAAESSNAQTRDTLKAVHETLAHIIGKLNDLEERASAPANAAAGEETAAASAENSSMAQARAQAQAAGIDLTMPEMPPAAPEPAPAARAPEAAAQSRPPGAEIKEDFIAAARRAALAAAGNAPAAPGNAPTAGSGRSSGILDRLRGKAGDEQTGPATPSPAAAAPGEVVPHHPAGLKPKMKKGLFDLSFLNRGKGEKTAKSADGGKRRLVLAGLALMMIATSAYFLMPRGGKAPAPVSGGSAAIEAPAAPGKSSAAPAHGQSGHAPRPARTQKHKKHAGGHGKQASMPAARPMAGSRAFLEQTKSPPMDTAALTTASIAPAPAAATPAPAPEIPQAIGTPALRKAALEGDPKAQFIVASSYLGGRVVKRDFAKAAQWYAKAAAQGLPVAQYRLGTLYERGRGLPRDAARARHWYERAARAGNVKAMHNLAVILADNKDGKADYAAAAHWFKAAAEHGLRDSQYNLAVLYLRGLGVKADKSQAYKWFALAARSGDMDAGQRMAALKSSLPAGQAATLSRQIAAWKPRHAVREANIVVIGNPQWRPANRLRKDAGRLKARDMRPLHDAKAIRKMQKLLARLGYDAGPADGRMGNRTANAIRLFQLQSGLPVNGQPSAQVLQLLRARTGASPDA